MSYDAPFAGLKVVDLSQGIAGPYAGMLLAQYGADVIKVEPPEGDWARALGRRYGDLSAFVIAANLGKRAIVLDLKAEEGRATLRRLVASADVFLESFRPGVAARLGFGYPDVAALSPRVIYLSVSGFGQTGPDAERPGVDTVFQAFTGLMSMNRGIDGIPHRVGVIVMDMATALSGTGPTYVFLLMEALVDAGVHLGFSRRVAEELVLRTVEGSALFARKSGRHLAELRNMVTSPGGTSAAAIYQLEKGALRTVLSKAVYAAYQRTRELGAEAERRTEDRP